MAVTLGGVADRGNERYGVREDEADIERVRLAMLAQARDPVTFALLDRVGVEPGMHVLEVGAGTGSVSAWLAERVGPRGRVMSTDVDLRFHAEMPSNVIVRHHDVTSDRLPSEHFDVVHARAVIQHLPERTDVLARLFEALKPGGAMVIEDGAMLEFAEQSLPEPYGSIHRLIAGASHDARRDPRSAILPAWAPGASHDARRDPNAGVRVLGWMRGLGLEGPEVVEDVWTMRPGEAAGEWWFLALERAVPRLVETGVVSEADGSAAMEQVREPGFAILSPTSIATVGRKPATTRR